MNGINSPIKFNYPIKKSAMLCFPNARITLGLQVKAKRRDGFHDIETVMLPVSMHDALEIVPAIDNQTKIIPSGIPIPGDPHKNLVMLALKLIQKELPLHSEINSEALKPLHIYLRKGIPACSGLAGGSSNGAFMLKMLNEYFKLNLTPARLNILAAKLGSDCPFFLQNKAMVVRGRGEILETIQTPNLSGFHLIIIVPPIGINTSEAYKLIIPMPERVTIKETLTMPFADWQENLKNDFEAGLFKKYPYLEKIKNRMISQGAVYASLSGSGSALYGLFEDAAVLSSLRKDFNDCLTGHYQILES